MDLSLSKQGHFSKHAAMKLRLRLSQSNLPRSQSNNHPEMTSPPGHHWEPKIKLQQLRASSCAMTTFANLVTTTTCNDHEVTSQKLNDRCLRCMRFCVALWLLSFQVPLEVSDQRKPSLLWRRAAAAWPLLSRARDDADCRVLPLATQSFQQGGVFGGWGWVELTFCGHLGFSDLYHVMISLRLSYPRSSRWWNFGFCEWRMWWLIGGTCLSIFPRIF